MLVSLSVYTRMVIFGFLYCCIALPVFSVVVIFSGFRRRKFGPFLRQLIVWYGIVIVRLCLRPHIRATYRDKTGGEPAVENCIMVLNHRSGSDPFLIAYVPWGKSPVLAINGWPMRLPFFGFFARNAEYIDVTRLPYEETKAMTLKHLEKGAPVVVFPEGTRSGNKEMNQFHGTFFRIAREAGVPIVPVAVAGNEKVPDRKFRMHSGHILIHRLPSIPGDEVSSTALFPLKERVRNLLIAETGEMDKELEDERK